MSFHYISQRQFSVEKKAQIDVEMTMILPVESALKWFRRANIPKLTNGRKLGNSPNGQTVQNWYTIQIANT